VGRRRAFAVVVAASLAVAAAAGSAWASVSAAAPRTLTVSVAGVGTVVGSPGRLACPRACRARLPAGTTVRLRARPASGWTFAGWTGACTAKSPTCAVRLRASARVGARFVRAPAPPPAAGFTPQTLAGTWDGTWQNQTFGSTGSARFLVNATSANSFTFTATLGGNVFGCSAPPPTSGEIQPGTGPNRWGAAGFSVEMTGAAGGKVSLSYDHATKTLTGSGTSGCSPGIGWKLTGRFEGDSFSGDVAISLPGGLSAASVLRLARSSAAAALRSTGAGP
jgi:hypothetical protein